MNRLETFSNTAIELSMTYGPKLLLALLTLFIGWRVIKRVINIFDKLMDRNKVDITLQRFLLSVTSVTLKAVLLVSVATMIGIETTSVIAMLGAAGIAVGLALQGSLANFAGGVLILFFKPFKVDDVIEAQGYLGYVKEIEIFNTILLTLDNQKVVIPNSMLSNGCVQNLFCEPTRRVDITFGISYEDSIPRAKEVIQSVIDADDRILDDLGHEIYVAEHADSSINLLVRVWVNSEDYWPVEFALKEEVKLAFDREKITIPFPQRDVHMINAAGA